ncbi:MAG: protease complex subunit PrcB family protein, partial [Nevskia sp.]|nr:protease complex subunit PrcB family protein [Nevskia sp.]
LLADPEAVRAWQEGRKLELIGVDPLPSPGPFVLVEMGVRLSAGYGIFVSREASLNDTTVRLNASLLTPDPGQAAAAAQVVTSPCVLVALPPGSYRAAELRDPAGTLLARADVVAPVQ